ncbi:TniQ family protein [Aurantivibrio plasticivorans]
MTARRLLPIAVRGVGTAEIESLPSYIHRLAHNHGVYVGELLRFSERQIKNASDYHGWDFNMPKYIRNHEMLRSNQLSRGLVDMLEYLTCQNLNGTWAAFINNALNLSKEELLEGFRWCPECLAEMEKLKEEPYFKLSWHFRAVKVCPIHRSSLLSVCEYCGCEQTSYRKQYDLGHCQECGEPLSKRRVKLEASDVVPSWEDTAQDVVDLIRDVQNEEYCSISSDGVVRSIDQLFDYYWRNNREADFYQLLDRDRLLAVIFHQNTLSLNDVRKLAFRLGVNLIDLISGNADKVSQRLEIGNFCAFPKSFLDSSVRQSKDHKAIERKLKKVAVGKIPLSLKATAKKLDVSVGYLEYRFPDIVRKIVDRYKEYSEKEHLHKIYHAQRKALDYFLDSNGELMKSRKKAYKELRQETGLPKWVLIDAIQRTYRALN